tara:strand:- start:22594 stop:24576 length:1983 start_codon:yes stop_codon:yes gene_type:complete
MISDSQKIQDAWLNIEVDESKLFNPMDFVMSDSDNEKLLERVAWLMMRPEYFSFACKYILNIELSPFQSLLLYEMWNRKFPMLIGSRGMGKSFILSVYPLLRALFMPRRKIIIVGAAFRQSKVLFEYMDTIWKNAPILRDLCPTNSGPRRDVDRCVMHIGQSTITCLPLGDGSKIRGQRANDIIADEFASIPRDIFENVVAGFAAVAASPIEKVKEKAKEKKAKELGVSVDKPNKEMGSDKSNQIILSGTAYYDFNHFAEYWKRYRSIVSSGGDTKKLEEVFGGSIPPGFDWTEYSIMRMSVDKLPDGFMDSGQIARAKATVHSGIYNMEYGAVFTTDSQGFFKRSLLESCTTSPTNPAIFPSGDVWFEASLKGVSGKKYVFGVDPASEVDNFSIVVMEVNSDHRRIVHCWTTNRQQHKDKLKSKIVDEDDFYSYCAKKIRQLMKVFPCVEIALDAQGGGIAVMEALHDKDKIPEGEVAIWPVIEEKPKDTDDHTGLHILRLCQFARADWLAEANHGLRKDFEDRLVLFPYFDSASLGIALEVDKASGRNYDTLEDCVMEIEELKDELSMIVMTQTSTGRERWDTPEVKTSAGRKSRLRKDRYSSLIMANMSARSVLVEKETIEHGAFGGFAAKGGGSQFSNEKLFNGPSWFTEKTQNLY